MNHKFDTVKNLSEIPLPFKKRETDAGYDLYSAESRVIWPFSTYVLKSNHKILIGEDYFGFVQARSGIRSKGLMIEGIIDAGYTGTIGIMVTNTRPWPRFIKKGERVAQIMFLPKLNIELKQVEYFNTLTSRGDKGFGSSGKL